MEVQNPGLLDGVRIGQGLIAEEDLGLFYRSRSEMGFFDS